MRKAVQTTIFFSLLAAAVLAFFGASGSVVALWLGAAWGLANFACMTRGLHLLTEGRKGWVLWSWLFVKFFGLYGLAAWFLVGLKVPAAGWLAGFTLSLAATALSAFPALKPLLRKGTPPAASFFLFALLSRAAEASEAARSGGAPAHPPEIPNLITLITHGSHGPIAQFLHTWENGIFAFVIVFIVGGLFAWGARSMALLPTRGQVAVEAVVQGVDGMICGVLGRKEGRRYLPFLGTLFIFILAMNLAGLVPGLKSPTSRFEMTGALGLCVFVYVQWVAVRRLGFVGYADHLIGQPRDAVGWILSPLMLFIHGIGEIVKPLSLALRLFGNIMGEDTLLGVFVTLGALTFAWSHLPIGIPLHLPFVLLAIIFSVVQALVFTMLSAIYITMMLPHEEHAVSSAGH